MWASGKDRTDPAELHTSFKLEKNGEFVGLYTAAGAPADSFSFGQEADVSLARIPDEASHLELTREPTPGASNRASPPFSASVAFSAPQGEHPGGVTVALASDLAGGAIRYTLDGSAPGTGSALVSRPKRPD